MSDESAASSQEFSLPTVGGGLHDIGEKLPRDLQTGDVNFTVSVALPDGLSGSQPQLNLVYSSGTFGAGWNLSIPGVNRQTSKDWLLCESFDDKGPLLITNTLPKTAATWIRGGNRRSRPVQPLGYNERFIRSD